MLNKINNICCIGAGYVGGPTMAVIADKCPHIEVNVVDINEERILAWNNPNAKEIPIFEPGLSEIVKRCRGINLHFSTEVNNHIAKADMIFISVNTPTKTKGLGAGQASDLKWVESSARQVAKYSEGHTIVVEKSTLPVRTAEVIKSILEATDASIINKKRSSFSVLSNPEFLSEGTAIEDLLQPDRVLIGGDDQTAIDALSDIYSNWIPEDKILETNIWSSELAKLTANAFLAQRVSSINSISALCETTGADVREVARAIGSDKRIGARFLNSGPGFGGSCFKKDILNLVYLCNYFSLPEVANFWEGVVKLNTWNQHRISSLVVKKLFGTITNKKIAILGFSFKANTNDTRESSAIPICKDLLEEGAFLNIHDPVVEPQQIAKDLDREAISYQKDKKDYDISFEGQWIFKRDLKSVCDGADAIIILTDWEEYFKIDWSMMAKIMRKPSWVFDSRSVIKKETIVNSKLNFWRIGDGSI